MVSEKTASSGEPGIQAPATVAASTADGADQRRLDDLPFADPVHVQADEQGDGDGAGDGERAPGTARDELDAAVRDEFDAALVSTDLSAV